MLIRAALRSGLFFAVGVLSAAPVAYSISGTFSDGATISGAITFDNATGTLVSFHVVTQHNAGDGPGSTYDSATGTGSVQYPLSPPPVSGTYFAILSLGRFPKQRIESRFLWGPLGVHRRTHSPVSPRTSRWIIVELGRKLHLLHPQRCESGRDILDAPVRSGRHPGFKPARDIGWDRHFGRTGVLQDFAVCASTVAEPHVSDVRLDLRDRVQTPGPARPLPASVS